VPEAVEVIRGIGPAQRRVLSALLAFKGWAVESSELKRLMGGDCSNARRSIRTLLDRGLIHQWTERGLRYHELDFVGWILALPLDPDDPAQKEAELLLVRKAGNPMNETKTEQERGALIGDAVLEAVQTRMRSTTP
jgi:hypothetical protein